MSFYNWLSQAETLVMVLTLVVGIGLSGFAMQRGRPASLPLIAFVVGLVGLLASWGAVMYARSGAVGVDSRFLVLGVGNMVRTMGFVVSHGLIYMALFGRQPPPLP